MHVISCKEIYRTERPYSPMGYMFIYVKPIARGRIYHGVSGAFAIYGGVIFGFALLDV